VCVCVSVCVCFCGWECVSVHIDERCTIAKHLGKMLTEDINLCRNEIVSIIFTSRRENGQCLCTRFLEN
jgi:hypothetical protein